MSQDNSSDIPKNNSCFLHRHNECSFVLVTVYRYFKIVWFHVYFMTLYGPLIKIHCPTINVYDSTIKIDGPTSNS